MALQHGRRREMRQMLVLSLLAHLAFMVLLVWSPRFSSRSAMAPLQGVVTVEILEAPPGAAPAAPPKPKARPAKKTVVLPDKPKAAPKPKAKPVPKKAAKKPEKKKPPPPQKSLADVMKELERKSGPGGIPFDLACLIIRKDH